MSFDDGVVYLVCGESEWLAELFTQAANDSRRLTRVAIDGGGLKVSDAGGSWTPPIGTTEEPT